MRNRSLVPSPAVVRVVHAPDDLEARQQAEHLERQFRSMITALRQACRVPPQPRWLFEDVALGKSMSPTQLFRAFSLLARCPDVPAAEVHAAADAFAALMTAGRTEDDASLATLVMNETRAQAEADVLQIHAAITDGQCVTTAERANEATAKHQVAARAVQRKLASALGERFVVRRPARQVASRER